RDRGAETPWRSQMPRPSGWRARSAGAGPRGRAARATRRRGSLAGRGRESRRAVRHRPGTGTWIRWTWVVPFSVVERSPCQHGAIALKGPLHSRELTIPAEDFQRLNPRRASDPDAPGGPGFKEFDSFELRGDGRYPKTFL